MLPTHKKLPFAYSALNSAGTQLSRLGFDLFPEDMDALLKTAEQKTGLSDFGAPYLLEGLKALLASINQDVSPHFFGRFVLNWMLTIYLTQRLLFVQSQKETPDRFRTSLIPPLIITGLPRSGTTFLHRLLCLDPNHHGIPLWQMLRPFNKFHSFDLRRKKAVWELENCHHFFTGIRRKHEVRVDQPEECIWLMGQTFQSPIFYIFAPVFSYVEWLLDQDRTQCYRDYVLMLRLLQNDALEKKFVLKAPEHMVNLDILLTLMPEVNVIQLHRDPVSCVLSLSSLVYSTHSALTDDVDSRRILDENKKLITHYLHSNNRIRRNPNIDRVILDLQYDELIQSPLLVIKSIYDHYELPWTDVYERMLTKYITSHLKGRYGVHEYSAEQFGTTQTGLQLYFKLRNDEQNSMDRQ